MPNQHRGEISALFDDMPHTLVLTLGALAELESAFGATDMLALAERFQSGRLSATDATKIIGAGLRAAGHAHTDDAVGRLRTPDGAAGYVAIVAKLLAATFGGPAGTIASAAIDAAINAPVPRASAVEDAPLPFLGAR